MASLCIDLHDQLKKFQVVWEVLDVVWESNDTDNELYKRVDKQGQITYLCIGEGQDPKFEAMVELPGVDVFQCIFSQIVSDCAQVQTELSDILEAQLVPNAPINRQELNEAVLWSSQAILNIIAATAYLARPKELIVHSLQGGLVESRVLRPHNQRSECVESQHDGILFDLAVQNGDLGAVVGKLLSVHFKR